MEIDRADVVAEVAEAFARYEASLVAQDHAALDQWFWNDPRVVRYGIRELQYGHDDDRGVASALTARR